MINEFSISNVCHYYPYRVYNHVYCMSSRNKSYTWLVGISDPSNLSVTAAVSLTIVDVNDNVPTFVSNSYSSTTYSDVALGTVVLTLSATDDDASYEFQTLDYYASDTSKRFQVNNQGQVFVSSSLLSFEDTTISTSFRVRNPDVSSTDSASVTVYVYRPTESSFFDDGAHIALVVLACIIGPVAIAGVAYLGYLAYTRWRVPSSEKRGPR